MDQIVNDIGETITLKVVDESINKWGDQKSTNITEKEISGHFEIMSEEDDDVEEGIFQAGDLRGFCDSTVNNLNNGNRVVYKDREYEIVEVINEPGIEGQSHYMFRARIV